MKKFITTAAIITALTLPAFAEGEQPSDKAGEAKGSVKATTEMNQEKGMEKGTNAMGAGPKAAAPSTMGAAGAKPPAANEKAGDTGAGEAKK